MRKCAKECYIKQKSCEQQDCRLHIEYHQDLNCTMIAVKKHGPMTLEQIGHRHQISTVRVKQLLDSTLGKLKKTLLKENTI